MADAQGTERDRACPDSVRAPGAAGRIIPAIRGCPTGQGGHGAGAARPYRTPPGIVPRPQAVPAS